VKVLGGLKVTAFTASYTQVVFNQWLWLKEHNHKINMRWIVYKFTIGYIQKTFKYRIGKFTQVKYGLRESEKRVKPGSRGAHHLG
jgi:hypothetical protein